MDYIPAEVAARSLGPANQVLGYLIQTLLHSYFSISDPGWPKDCGESAENKASYDFIVVGAGAAGSVIAGRLSENPNWKVLLLEAGEDPPIESEIPNMAQAMQKTKYDWQYQADPKVGCLASTNKRCAWPRGKMLGGSTAMSGMKYVFGNRNNYDLWASMGNKGWDYETLLKYKKRLEGNKDPSISAYKDGFYHNQSGPVHISRFAIVDPLSHIFMSAYEESGNEHISDINADKTLGYLHYQGFVHEGLRQSAARAYLIPARYRWNLCVVKNAHAYKILFDDDKKAIGVEYDYKGKKMMTAYAKKDVILSGGTIGSAQLLLLSGIGPKNQLQHFNIPLISDLPVGENLIDHVAVILYARFEGDIPVPTDWLDDIYKYFIHKTGSLSSVGISELGGLQSSKNNTQYEHADLQTGQFYYPQNSEGLAKFLELQLYEPAIQEKLVKANLDYHIAGIFVVVLQPKSVGDIVLKSKSYKDHPAIDPNYYSHPNDMGSMLSGIKRQIKLERTKTFKERKGRFIKLPLPECDQFKYKSDDYWRCYCRHMSFPYYHAVGTSKMAPQSNGGVVDPKLRFYGVSNLRQADMGIAPYVPSGNTIALALTIGEAAADIIKNDHS